MLDDRDILLTRWRRPTDSPVLRDDQPFGCIVYDPDNAIWRLFYHADANTGAGTIEQVTSPNGRVWSNPVTALAKGAGGTWDDADVGVPFVWYESGEDRPWRMLYRGKNGVTDIGLTTSTDGTTWERKDTEGGALSGPVITGDGGEWDEGDIDGGSCIKVGSTYYYYYNRVSSPRQIGLATSTDLVTWTKHGSNPLYKASVLPDAGAEPDYAENAGRFCPDIVRWDDKSGNTRYVMFVPHYTGVHTLPEIEVYTDTTPTFTRATRTFVGLAFETAPGTTYYQEGCYIDGSGCDTPHIVCDDIGRNVGASDGTDPYKLMAVSVYTTTHGWNQEIWVHDPKMAGASLSSVFADLPITAPRYKLQPNGDGQTVALWLPGATGTLFDLSGNGNHLYSQADYIDSDGAYLDAAKNNFLRRDPNSAIAALNAVVDDFTIEIKASMDSALGSGSYRALFRYGIVASTDRHWYIFLTGDDGGDYEWNIYCTKDDLSGINAVSDTFTWTPEATHRWSFCRSGTTMRFFKDGVQIGANKTLNGTIKTTAADGRILIGVDANGTTLWWDGYIDEIRISNNARHTANYTAAALGYVFAASGTIFGPVLDFGRGGVRACLSPELDLVPADTSITLKARAATDADDLSTTIGDFSEFPAVLRPCGRFHQYAAVLAASDRTVSPVIASLLGFGRGPSRGGGSR